MLRRDVTPGFRIDLHHKDLGIVLDTAREAGVVIPLGALVAQLLGAVRAHGDGGLDHTALLAGVERLSGGRREQPDLYGKKPACLTWRSSPRPRVWPSIRTCRWP